MKRLIGTIVLMLLMAGCATMPWSQKVDYSDGINRREAKLIARDFIASSQYAEDVSRDSVKTIENKMTACLDNHWLVEFADANPFWKLRFYYVIVDNVSGKVVRFGVNWYQGDYWSPMLRGIDQCR